MHRKISIGLPRIHAEAGERRAFLPLFVHWLENNKYHVYMEHSYGSGMGYKEQDYLRAASKARCVGWEETYQQKYVLVLRYPGDDVVRRMSPGSTLISMLHYPTRPERVELLKSLGIEAVSLDGIVDDNGRRLVEALSMVAWNGVEAAMKLLHKIYPPPGFESLQRPPIRVTLLGPGAVGSHVIRAAVQYGDTTYRQRMVKKGVMGVQVTAIDYDLTGNAAYMRELLSQTDMLVDATQRPDPSRPVIPNDWIAWMPEHAVLLDLSVDPYDLDHNPPVVKGIEGIPQGNLDQYTFAPKDPAYKKIPEGVCTSHRRHAVSCYSWPGVHPERCMDHYGKQLRPLLRTINEADTIENISPRGDFFHRAISRAMLSRWDDR